MFTDQDRVTDDMHRNLGSAWAGVSQSAGRVNQCGDGCAQKWRILLGE